MSNKSKNRFNAAPVKTATAGKTMVEEIAELKERVFALEQVIGVPGPRGEKGDTGAQGKQGEKGAKGGFSLTG